LFIFFVLHLAGRPLSVVRITGIREVFCASSLPKELTK